MQKLFYITKGLENTAEKEIRESLDNPDILEKNQKYIIAETQSQLQKITSLKTVDDAHLLLDKQDFQTKPSSDQIIDNYPSEKLQNAISELSKFRKLGDCFSITVSRYKNKQADIEEIESEIERDISHKINKKFMQNSKNSKIDFRVHLEQRRILYSVRIDSRPLYFREYREKGRKGSLKPSIAAGLVEMADVKPGQKIVDNFAGAGTILCEAQLQGLEVYGGDIDRDAVKCSRENLSNISEEASNQIKRLDGRDSPHPDNCFDAAVSNIPWGKQVDLNEVELYSQTFEEYSRILKASGTLIILCDNPELARKHIEKNFPAYSLKSQKLGFLGQNPTVLIARPG